MSPSRRTRAHAVWHIVWASTLAAGLAACGDQAPAPDAAPAAAPDPAPAVPATPAQRQAPPPQVNLLPTREETIGRVESGLQKADEDAARRRQQAEEASK